MDNSNLIKISKTQLEIERKYLVKFPKSWSDLSLLFDNLVDIKRISQTYLQPSKTGEPSPRVRKTIEGLTQDTEVVYHYNQKFPIEDGINKEVEKEISKKQYDKYLEKPLPNKFTLEKTRFVFNYKNQTFELDVFKGPLKGLAILEIELANKKQKVQLPPYLKVIKEVTDEKKYNNFSLCEKK